MSEFPIDALIIEEAERINSDAWTYATCPFPQSPSQYLDHARHDLADESERGNLNAFCAAKRALDCQIDFIFWNLGLPKPKKPGVPVKFEALERVGAAPPEILRKIIRQRNNLEHEYASPEREAAQDAVDIAELFLRATKDLAPIRYADWDFWSPATRIGGSFTFAYTNAEGEGDPDAVERDKFNQEDPPIGVRYSFYRSTREDRHDPLEILNDAALEHWRATGEHGEDAGADAEEAAGIARLGEGFVSNQEAELYQGFLRAMVRRITMRGD